MKAVIAGSTGLVGSLLVQSIAQNKNIEDVCLLVRKPQNKYSLPFREIVVDFDNLKNYKEHIKGDVVFCCLGTTIQQAGSKEQFFKVDFTYPFQLAQVAAQNGVKKFIIVTAMGANTTSMFYYNRVKGEVENAVSGLPFEFVGIIRPSLLLGDRKESRLGEDIGKLLSNWFSFLIPDAYKGIEASKVAYFMQKIAVSNEKGVQIYESDILQRG